MKITGTMHVLAVPDLQRSCAWYRDALGFEVREIGDDGWRILVRDACRIMVGECTGAMPAVATGDHSYCLYIHVDDADGYFAAARAFGAEFIKTVRDEPWGLREFGVRTIDGHRIMIGQPLEQPAQRATHTSAALRDLHTRAQSRLTALLEHCRTLAPDELNRELDGFGCPSVRVQLHHIIGAEAYWIGVLEGRVEADLDDAAYPTIDALESWRAEVAAATAAYLRGTDDAGLNVARPMDTWGGQVQTLVPAQVFMRTLTHNFHHQGQMATMCRLLGKPVAGLDWPLD